MTVLTILRPHQKDLGGGFMVRRLLPAVERRSVGPFVFFDHFGPSHEVPEVNHDVRPHPHIGLATVTYLFEGCIRHHDSLGTVQDITPGAINWMSAGSGIVHSERRPPQLADSHYVNHGLQLWVALPQAHEESAPSFVHTPAEAIPALQEQGASVRVLVGEAFGLRSPVQTLSPTLYLDLALPAGARFNLPALAPEMAVYSVDAAFRVDDEEASANTLTVLATGRASLLEAGDAPVRLMLVGGAPLDGPRHMWWNFVSSRKERIQQAAEDWQAQRMGQIAGETEFIPLPAARFT